MTENKEVNLEELGSGAMDSVIEHTLQVCTGHMRRLLLFSHNENLALRKIVLGGDVGRVALLEALAVVRDSNKQLTALLTKKIKKEGA